jgi:hypothetical protein
MTDRPDTAREALAAWLAEEAALYETAAGQLDGIPFETVAHVFRVIEARIRRGGADAALTASGYAIVPAAEGEVIERHDLLGDYGDVWMGPSKDGDYVLFSDHQSHLERLAAENERLREAAAFHEHNWQQERDIKTAVVGRAERAEAENERLKAAAKAVEDWWLSDGMRIMEAAGEVGAPYAIFAARAALTQEPS